jgi:hypothetical protein
MFLVDGLAERAITENLVVSLFDCLRVGSRAVQWCQCLFVKPSAGFDDGAPPQVDLIFYFIPTGQNE